MKTKLLLITLLLTFVPLAFGRGTVFPGQAHARSPRGTYEIRCVPDKNHEGPYSLIIQNSKTKTARAIFSGDRYSEVLWKKNARHLAITDWACSNSATIYIARPSAGTAKPLVSMIDTHAIEAAVRREELAGHCYWEALRWENDGRLRFRIFGHTDTNPSHEFSYTLRANLTTRSVTLLHR